MTIQNDLRERTPAVAASISDIRLLLRIKSLPKSAVQLIVLYWRWNDDQPVKREMMRQFKYNFDVAALEKLMDR